VEVRKDVKWKNVTVSQRARNITKHKAMHARIAGNWVTLESWRGGRRNWERHGREDHREESVGSSEEVDYEKSMLRYNIPSKSYKQPGSGRTPRADP